MRWTPEAETAIRKVPFFVRKKVRDRVEEEALAAGKSDVSLAEVRATQARYLKKMSQEIKGFQVETCFGPGGCPNTVRNGAALMERIEKHLQEQDLLGLLKERVKGELKFHHEFRVTLAECPNACSQPQIKDIGVIGAAEPVITDEPCSLCQACVEACREKAVTLDESSELPVIDLALCVACGQCMAACPTGTLDTGASGYIVLLGGKLGRHPRLARKLPGIHSEDEVMGILAACTDFYRENSLSGRRFAEILGDVDFEHFVDQFGKKVSVAKG